MPGCTPGGPPLPDTFPVSGSVMHKGGQPLGGGQIIFRLTDDPTLVATGVIGPDGTFSLQTFRDNRKVPGAVAGAHRVTVMPPMGEDQSVMAVELPEPYKVEAAPNEFRIVIDDAAAAPP